jgi:hypothetical protein
MVPPNQLKSRSSIGRTISAIKLVSAEESSPPTGLFTQLPLDAPLEMCGEGFSKETALVRCHGVSYVVFRQDLEIRHG